MQKEVKNLFKHEHPFKLFSTERDIYEAYIRSLVFLYRTKKIQNGATIDIYSIDDLFKKVKPFLLYLMSMSNTKTIQEYQLFNGVYDILIKTYDQKYDLGFTFKRLLRFEIDYRNDLNFSDIDFQEYNESYNKYFQKPFEIHIDVNNYYKTVLDEDEDENESESEDEPEEEEITIVQEYERENGKIPIIKTFKEDKCIICLENKPNILYEHCRHIPTCSKCEEIENLNKCPICRRIATLKFKIYNF